MNTFFSLVSTFTHRVSYDTLKDGKTLLESMSNDKNRKTFLNVHKRPMTTFGYPGDLFGHPCKCDFGLKVHLDIHVKSII